MVLPANTARSARFERLFSQRGRNVEDAFLGDPQDSAKRISLIYGFPDAASLPASSVAESTVRAMESNGEWALQYARTEGVLLLVDAILEKLSMDQGINASRNELMLTAGSSQAIQLLLDLLIDWDDTVIVEAPTWMGFLWALKNVGGKPVPIPVDDQGMRLDVLKSKLADMKVQGVTPKFIYVMPNFQNPSGVSMSLERRKALLEIAQKYGTLILEDDAYFDLRYTGSPLPTIYSLDSSKSTMYISTLSKIMGAGMRIGWLVAPEEIIQTLSVLKVDGSTNVFGAFVAADWVPRHLRTHIEQLKQTYVTRRDVMLTALQKHMPEGTTWTTPHGGFFVLVTAPNGLNMTALHAYAKERGIEYLPGSTCFVDDAGHDTIRLAFSFATEDQIEEGIRILGEVVAGELLESKRN